MTNTEKTNQAKTEIKNEAGEKDGNIKNAETKKRQAIKNAFGRFFGLLNKEAGQQKGIEQQKDKNETEKQAAQQTKKVQRISIAKEEKNKAESYINLVDIALDSYDDIFSDFDPSPYTKRALSMDLIKEIERRCDLSKGKNAEIVFSLPKKMRNAKDEAVIKERLKEYFTKRAEEINDEVKKEKKLDAILVGGGVVFITISNIISAYAGENSVFLKILHEITLVPGWVGEFLGLERMFLETKKIRENGRLYEKLKDAVYIFVSTEDVLKKMSEGMQAQGGQQTEAQKNEAQKNEEKPKE